MAWFSRVWRCTRWMIPDPALKPMVHNARACHGTPYFRIRASLQFKHATQVSAGSCRINGYWTAKRIKVWLNAKARLV
ncbi:MAG: hypothetical protein F4X92_10120 [Gammaproteobacteria bacterium]|nr:hypothetical protein [Gammaproteobacteria bacterium]